MTASFICLLVCTLIYVLICVCPLILLRGPFGGLSGPLPSVVDETVGLYLGCHLDFRVGFGVPTVLDSGWSAG